MSKKKKRVVGRSPNRAMRKQYGVPLRNGNANCGGGTCRNTHDCNGSVNGNGEGFGNNIVNRDLVVVSEYADSHDTHDFNIGVDSSDLVVFSEHDKTYYQLGPNVTIQLPEDKYLLARIHKTFVGRNKKYVGKSSSHNYGEQYFFIKYEDLDTEEMDASDIDKHTIEVRKVPNNQPSVYNSKATTHTAEITKKSGQHLQPQA